MKTILEYLKELDNLFIDSDRWIQFRSRSIRRDKNHKIIYCYCLSAGIELVIETLPAANYSNIMEKIANSLVETIDPTIDLNYSLTELIKWNDYPGRTFEDVKQLIAKAIKKEEENAIIA